MIEFTKKDEHNFIVGTPAITLVRFEINVRHMKNGHRRSRAHAITVWCAAIGQSVSLTYGAMNVEGAIKYIKNMDFDPAEFIQAAIAEGWGDVMSAEYTLIAQAIAGQTQKVSAQDGQLEMPW